MSDSNLRGPWKTIKKNGGKLLWAMNKNPYYFPLNPGWLIGILIMVYYNPDMGVSKNRGTPKWMVYNGKPYKMDDLGLPLFSETSIYLGNINPQKITQPTRGPFFHCFALDDAQHGSLVASRMPLRGVSWHSRMGFWLSLGISRY